MKKSKILFFILPIVFLFACIISPKKISLSGRAIYAVTCVPLQNALLDLGYYHATGTGYSLDNLDETYTDANGNYQFESKNASGNEVYIAVNANKYFETAIYDYIISEAEHVNNFNIHFTPIGCIKLRFHEPASSYSNLEIGLIGNYTINHHLTIGSSNPNSSSVVLESKGDQYNSIDSRVYKYLNSSLIFTENANRSFYCLA